MLYLDGHGGIFPKKNKFPKLKNTRIPHSSKNWDPPTPLSPALCGFGADKRGILNECSKTFCSCHGGDEQNRQA